MGFHLAAPETGSKDLSEIIQPLSRWERVSGALKHAPPPFPFDAVFEARDHWRELRDDFLRELTNAVADPETVIIEQNALPMYAMFLAAEMRDRAFAPALLALLRLRPDDIDDVVGETALSESLGRCLGAVWFGNEVAIRNIADDRSLNIYVRLAAIDALIVRAIEGDSAIADVTKYVFDLAMQSGDTLSRRLASVTKQASMNEYWVFFNFLIVLLADLGAIQYWEQFEAWDRAGLIHPNHETLSDLQKRMFASVDVRRAGMFKPFYVYDTVEEMSGWACFDEPTLPYVRALPKVGRNDPCHCGSGKKFKKCHGASV